MTAPDTAEVEVICPGVLEVLSVGKGDLRLTVGGDDPAEIEKGRQVIEEMIRKGYGIFVETDKGLARVKTFNPHRMTYINADVPDAEPDAEAASSPAPSRRGRKRTVDREVPVAGSKAKAVTARNRCT